MRYIDYENNTIILESDPEDNDERWEGFDIEISKDNDGNLIFEMPKAFDYFSLSKKDWEFLKDNINKI